MIIKLVGPKKASDWVTVGKLWSHKTVPGAFVGRFGMKTNTKTGLVDIFKSMEVSADDVIQIRPNNKMRDGKKDPCFYISVLAGTPKAVKPAKK